MGFVMVRQVLISKSLKSGLDMSMSVNLERCIVISANAGVSEEFCTWFKTTENHEEMAVGLPAMG